MTGGRGSRRATFLLAAAVATAAVGLVLAVGGESNECPGGDCPEQVRFRSQAWVVRCAEVPRSLDGAPVDVEGLGQLRDVRIEGRLVRSQGQELLLIEASPLCGRSATPGHAIAFGPTMSLDDALGTLQRLDHDQ